MHDTRLDQSCSEPEGPPVLKVKVILTLPTRNWLRLPENYGIRGQKYQPEQDGKLNQPKASVRLDFSDRVTAVLRKSVSYTYKGGMVSGVLRVFRHFSLNGRF